MATEWPLMPMKSRRRGDLPVVCPRQGRHHRLPDRTATATPPRAWPYERVPQSIYDLLSSFSGQPFRHGLITGGAGVNREYRSSLAARCFNEDLDFVHCPIRERRQQGAL